MPAFAGRVVVLAQSIRYDYERPVTDLHRRLVIIPRASHGDQRCASWQLRTSGAPVTSRATSRDRFGNVVVEVRFAYVEE